MRQLFVGGAVLAIALFAGSGARADNKAPFSRRNPIVEAVEKTRDSIVTVKIPRATGRDMVGTGVVIEERGFVVTNRHVVGGASRVSVLLADGTALTARVLAADAGVDLAILRLETNKKLKALKPGPVTDLMVGETVIAIGHPFGYTNTVSTGIISALKREITMPTGDVLSGLIQTSAPINPGNSGGPLLNINGELIGINVALRDGAQNIAFAINAGTVENMLRKHLSALRLSGVSHGLSCKEKVLAETGDRQRVVLENAPETCGDLKEGDEILAVGNRGVANIFDIERALWDKQPGQKVALKVSRGSRELTVQLTLLPGNGSGQVAAVRHGTSPRTLATSTGVPVGNRP